MRGQQGELTVAERQKARVSVVILTKNEECNIAECIKGVSWADEIVVLDSCSTDSTVEIARECGVKVVQRIFDNYSANKNWALDNLEFRHSWIIFLDADERTTPELACEVAKIVAGPTSHVGYYIPRQNWFGGVWLRYGGSYPDYSLRLLRRGCGRYEPRLVHEHIQLTGSAGFLKTPLVHLNDNKGMKRYLERHIEYAHLEAVEAHKLSQDPSGGAGVRGRLLARGPMRRRALKHLAYRYLPARPLLVFIWMYVLKLGFLNGRVGLRYCLLRMFYEFQIDLFLDEMRRRGLPSGEACGRLTAEPRPRDVSPSDFASDRGAR